MTLLRIEHLGVRYGDRAALAGLSLDVAAGEIVGLVGESGSGKSTAALATIGLLPGSATTTGRIQLDGIDVAADMRGGAIGMVFQEPMTALNPIMTIGAQVAETIRLHKRIGRREAAAAAAQTLLRVGLSPDRAPPGRYPHQLSGGQRQRVAIAIAIAAGPQLLIADEPTTALDVTTQAHILELLVGLVRQDGMGLLLVSHDLGVVAQVADRIVVMKDGGAVEHGATLPVLTAPDHAYTRNLLAKARHVPVRHDIVSADAAPVLDVRDLGRSYPGARRGWRRGTPLRAVDGVSFTVRPGETVGIVGESGSGKTTLLRTVLGLDRPQSGEVLLQGQPLHASRGPALRQLRRQMQAVFQDPQGSFDPRQRVGQIVAEPLHLLDTPLTQSERDRRIAAALEQVGLSAADADRHPHEFSGGQRQRIAIARALIVEPALVVLDEAVSALDVSIRADILDLLAALSDRTGLAYLFVSHDLSVMKAVTDRLLVIHDGRIVEQGPTAALLAAPEHPYTAELVAATPDLDRVLAGRTSQA
jgi:peptide/nickel transport system ATP-binding protein